MSNNIIDKIQLSGVTYDIGGQGGSGVSVVEVTQAEYDALPSSAKTDTSKMYVITDAEAGDLTNYYTKTETNTLLGGKADTATTYTKSEVDNAITAATATKQDTLVSGTNIKTINNESILGSGNIDIQGGGGSSYSAGNGIDITNNVISVSLPISAGTGDYSIIEGQGTETSGNYSHAEGRNTKANGMYSHAEGINAKAEGNCSHAEGDSSIASGNFSHAEGRLTSAITEYSHAEGNYTKTSNNYEHASGLYNNSVSASTTFGDSGNTLFSVGNGTSNSARHNAFEIRQNGDIYLSSGGTDIKLQDHLGGGGGSITIDPTLDSGSTNPVANSAITEAVLVPSYRGLIEVEDNIAFPNATALYVENVTSGAYQDATMIEFYLSGVSEVSENILVTSFSGHTFNTEPSYMDYEWTEDNSLIFTPKTSGNYFYKIHNGWDTGFGVYIIDDYSSGSSSSVIQNEIYPRLNNLTEKVDSFDDTKVTGVAYSNLYNDYGGYWYHEINIYDNHGGRFATQDQLRYNDFGYDDGIIFVKKTSGATSGSTDCITSGGVYEQMGGMKIVKLTQSAYDALSPNYDSNTLYVIVN